MSAEQLGDIIDLISAEKISSKIAKDLFDIVWTNGGNPQEIVEKKGMLQVSDVSSIEEVVDTIIRDNPDQVLKLEANPKLAGWFVGQVMRATDGKANPKSVNEILKERLKF
jgi:aspartyl-tRNA(Asn)/glutamyl-tRNA(Gln) amidotransferase subunit B